MWYIVLMEDVNIKEKAQTLKEFKLPRWDELPAFDIYMDQVVNYINQHLTALNIDDTDKPLTPSMVNNYVKNSIVKAPVKKHYKRYHLAFLIVVIVLKRVYSLSEISKMIEIQTTMKDSDLKSAYDTFGLYFERCLKTILDHGDLDKTGIHIQNEYQALLLNIIKSVVLKIYAEMIISTI